MTNLAYVELHCHSYYSLLDGASSPEALVEQALEAHTGMDNPNFEAILEIDAWARAYIQAQIGQ